MELNPEVGRATAGAARQSLDASPKVQRLVKWTKEWLLSEPIFMLFIDITRWRMSKTKSNTLVTLLYGYSFISHSYVQYSNNISDTGSLCE